MISEFVRIQAEGYVLCLMVGAAMGIVGVVFGGLRKLLRSGKIVTWFCDLALWLVLSVAIIALNYICCGGRIRLYIFLGFFSSFLLVFFTINWAASKIANHILCKKKQDSKNVKM